IFFERYIAVLERRIEQMRLGLFGRKPPVDILVFHAYMFLSLGRLALVAHGQQVQHPCLGETHLLVARRQVSEDLCLGILNGRCGKTIRVGGHYSRSLLLISVLLSPGPSTSS